MKLSHSKLSQILSCPMSYYLNYIQGISKIEEKPALAIGSAVHWGIEHNTEDLTDYFKEHGNFKTRDSYGREQLLSEAMVHGYLKHKDELFDKILIDPDTKEKIELAEETHELYLTGKLKSFVFEKAHEFVGIIDLLLLTDKGFIVVDYKTSSYEPDWDAYLDQLYRYIFLLRSEFPDVPIIKIAIINIRKTAIRQKKNENQEQFFIRLKQEYEWNDDNYVNYHEFAQSTIDERLLNEYILNLSRMADTAQTIIENKLFYINYAAANGTYGKSDYWDIFYGTKGAEVLYKISDFVLNKDANEPKFVTSRQCVDIDMKVCDYKNVLNKFEIYEKEFANWTNIKTDCTFENYLKDNYIVNDNLLKLYHETFIEKQKSNVNTL